MTLWWVYRSVPHLGASYNLDLSKYISAFWGTYMYNYKYYARCRSSKKGEQVAAAYLGAAVTVLSDATATVGDASPNH